MGFFDKILNYEKDDSLIRDSFVLFIATLFANIAAFFYHFYMGRVLGPADYGVLGVVISLVYLISVPVNVIQASIAKFTADYKAKGNDNLIGAMYKKSLFRFFVFGFVAMLLFFIFIPVLSDFLKISALNLVVFAPIVVFALVLPVVRGLLQGKQIFRRLGFNIIVEALTKLIFGILLVYIGFHIYGAIAGIVFSFIVAFSFLYFRLRGDFSEYKFNNNYNMSQLCMFIMPVFFSLLLLTLYYTIDVILVKHYFSDVDAGYYAALSLIGKIVFFASVAISTVMFPKVADLHARKKPSKNILYKSIVFVLLIAVPAVVVYFLMPKLVVGILMGNAYISIASMLWMFAVVMTFFSLTYLLVFYNLSVGRKNFLGILVAVLAFECIAIVVYHPSLFSVVFELVLLNLLSFVLMLIYTLLKNGKSQNYQ